MLAADEACTAALKSAGAETNVAARQRAYEKSLAAWKKAVDAAQKAGKKPPRKPRGPIQVGDLYASKIAPFVPYGIRGVLWDQGEAGTAVPAIDQFTMMGALIKGWRNTWEQGEFPFLYVQKISGGGCAWDSENNLVTRNADPFTKQPTIPMKDADGLYRELHIKIMQHPNTAMVTASDLGSGIHPTNKSGYGQRACDVALGFVYGQDVAIYGPIYKSHRVEKNQIRIEYSHIGKGLAWKHGDGLQGFEIAGKDGNWKWATATIDGDNVIVSHPDVPNPQHVRYGWSKNRAWANLFNKDGLPALTFQSR